MGILAQTWGHGAPQWCMPHGGWGGRPRETQSYRSEAIFAWVNAAIDFQVQHFGGLNLRQATPRGIRKYVLRLQFHRRGCLGLVNFIQLACANTTRPTAAHSCFFGGTAL
jgi:hypothetical protein